MARITSRDLQKGTTLTVVQQGPLFPPNFSYLGANGGVTLLAVGEVFEVLRCAKGNTASMELHLKEVGGAGRTGWQFLGQAAPLFEVLSQPEAPQALPRAAESDPRLSDDEEFAIVLKSDPAQWFQQVHTSRLVESPDQTAINQLIFTTKSGKRKRFKNMQAVGLHLREISGSLHDEHWRDLLSDPSTRERAFHLHSLDSFAYRGNPPDHAIPLPEIEIRKYNRDTRKLASIPVDYDVAGYIAKFRATMLLLSLHGEAVSALADQLAKADQLEKYPHVFSAYFDERHFRFAFEVPREKDLYLELALKQLGLKKKDAPLVNKDGFSAIAFETKAELDAFSAAYKLDPKKKSTTLEWKTLDPSVDLSTVVDFYKKEDQRRLSREAAAPKATAPEPNSQTLSNPSPVPRNPKP